MFSKDELLKKLEDIADEWSRNTGLHNDYSEGIRYNEIKDKLAVLGVNARIDSTRSSDSEGSWSQFRVYMD